MCVPSSAHDELRHTVNTSRQALYFYCLLHTAARTLLTSDVYSILTLGIPPVYRDINLSNDVESLLSTFAARPSFELIFAARTRMAVIALAKLTAEKIPSKRCTLTRRRACARQQ